MYTNADSLLNKRKELEVHIQRAQPLSIGITEVKPKNAKFDVQLCELALDGYELTSNVHEAGRGVALYLHNSLKATRSIVNDTIGFTESIWAEVRLPDEDRLLVGCVYRSPSSNDINNDKVCQLMREAGEKRCSHVLVLGDFNYPKINWSDSSCAEDPVKPAYRFLESVHGSYLVHVIEPTRYRVNQNANTSDLIFTNEEGMVKEVEYGPHLGASDHVILTFDFHCRTLLPRELPERYLYDRGQYDRLRNLMDIDWTAELEDKSTQESWNLIVEHLQTAIAASIPMTRRRSRGKFKPLWMNGEALAKVKTKRDTWKRYKTPRDERDYKV